MDCSIITTPHGREFPLRIAEGFTDGIAYVLDRIGYSAVQKMRGNLDFLTDRIMTDHPSGRLRHPDGSININIASTNAWGVLYKLWKAGESPLFFGMVSGERFVPPGYNFCRASSMFLFGIKDGALDETRMISPHFGVMYLSTPAIGTDSEVFEKVGEAELYDRAFILGAHEMSHLFFDSSHCRNDLCVMTSGEIDGLHGEIKDVCNRELDMKVQRYRKDSHPYYCRDHDISSCSVFAHPLVEYTSDEQPK